MISVPFAGALAAQRKIRNLYRIDVAENATGIAGQVVAGTVDLTSGSNQAVNASSASMVAGQAIYGPGIPPGTVVLSRSGTTLTLSAAATTTATGSAAVVATVAKVLLRDTDQNGTILVPITIAPGASQSIAFNPPIPFPNGLYLQVIGTVRGSVTGD